jgi:hypothetical protein
MRGTRKVAEQPKRANTASILVEFHPEKRADGLSSSDNMGSVSDAWHAASRAAQPSQPRLISVNARIGEITDLFPKFIRAESDACRHP